MHGEKCFFSPCIGPVHWASWGTGDCEASAGDSHPGRQVRVWCQVGDGWRVKREVVAASLRAARSSCVRSAATANWREHHAAVSSSQVDTEFFSFGQREDRTGSSVGDTGIHQVATGGSSVQCHTRLDWDRGVRSFPQRAARTGLDVEGRAASSSSCADSFAQRASTGVSSTLSTSSAVADDSSLCQAIKLKLKGNKRARQDCQPSLMRRQVTHLLLKTIAECLKPVYLYSR
jgi:hypothetical protein